MVYGEIMKRKGVFAPFPPTSVFTNPRRKRSDPFCNSLRDAGVGVPYCLPRIHPSLRGRMAGEGFWLRTRRGFAPFRVEKLREAVMRGCHAPQGISCAARRNASTIPPSRLRRSTSLCTREAFGCAARGILRVPRVEDDGSKDVACLVMQIGHKDPTVVQQQYTIVLP